MDQIDNVQKRATRQLPGFKNLSYPDRLRKLKLPTLCYRRLRGDLIEAYKILNHVYDPDCVPFMKLWNECVPDLQNTRSGERNCLKLFKYTPRLDVRYYSFSVRVVKAWNELGEQIVNAPSVNSFKNQLDNLYITKEIYYDYEDYKESRKQSRYK